MTGDTTAADGGADIGPRAPTEGELVFMQTDLRMAAADPLTSDATVLACAQSVRAAEQAMDRVTPEHMAASEDWVPAGTSMWATSPGTQAAVDQAAFGAAVEYVTAAYEMDAAIGELEAGD